MIVILRIATDWWWNQRPLNSCSNGQLPMIVFTFLDIMIFFLIYFLFVISHFSYVLPVFLGCALLFLVKFRFLI
jgi:hypothetical protein